jgi:hypothetical protein
LCIGESGFVLLSVDNFPRPLRLKGWLLAAATLTSASSGKTHQRASYWLCRRLAGQSQTRMWGDWMTIGDDLLEGRVAGTNKPEGRGYVTAYAEWLKRFKVEDMDKSDRAKLLQLMEERPAVEEWRATLTDYERRNLNNPIVVWRKWTAAHCRRLER